MKTQNIAGDSSSGVKNLIDCLTNMGYEIIDEESFRDANHLIMTFKANGKNFTEVKQSLLDVKKDWFQFVDAAHELNKFGFDVFDLSINIHGYEK